jgi:hypothetical protein
MKKEKTLIGRKGYESYEVPLGVTIWTYQAIDFDGYGHREIVEPFLNLWQNAYRQERRDQRISLVLAED